MTEQCETCRDAAIDGECPSECLWACSRGRTRLVCQLRAEAPGIKLEVLRNSRVYASYRFSGRKLAVAFASRLQYTFEGNGWIAA